ncbi:organic hydroperoxide resistance protein [Rhodococcus sp. NPDC003318]|uniref:organic hydroperoxide resistance protein n=1 Tax=Rhodococcus sp. NPDC003318 TaxID=3364503 RepID=UPI0036A1116B
MSAIYTAEALVTGDGRNGQGRTSDGRLDLTFAIPAEMGGTGEGTNPEQLFALGYAACYLSALRMVGRQDGADVTDSAVGARVSILTLEGGGFTLDVTLEVSLPHLTREAAQELAEKTDQVCPYSNATRGNINVTILVVED